MTKPFDFNTAKLMFDSQDHSLRELALVQYPNLEVQCEPTRSMKISTDDEEISLECLLKEDFTPDDMVWLYFKGVDESWDNEHWLRNILVDGSKENLDAKTFTRENNINFKELLRILEDGVKAKML